MFLSTSVRVSNATLKEGTSTVTEQLQVIRGFSKTLTCDTSVSRPAATIVWYIGTQEKHRSTFSTFSFSPQTTDHNKTVYCKAFNIQPENQAVVSYKSILFVQGSLIYRMFLKMKFFFLSDEQIKLLIPKIKMIFFSIYS
jgi:hypothetical protein